VSIANCRTGLGEVIEERAMTLFACSDSPRARMVWVCALRNSPRRGHRPSLDLERVGYFSITIFFDIEKPGVVMR
jgi:hypothetical protein